MMDGFPLNKRNDAVSVAFTLRLQAADGRIEDVPPAVSAAGSGALWRAVFV